MTDEEFDVLDELYFVQSFNQLLELTGKDSGELSMVLKQLFQKGWIKVLVNRDEEVPEGRIDFGKLDPSYYFLATKSGLMAHNS